MPLYLELLVAVVPQGVRLHFQSDTKLLPIMQSFQIPETLIEPCFSRNNYVHGLISS